MTTEGRDALRERVQDVLVPYASAYAGEPEFGVRVELSKGALAAIMEAVEEHPVWPKNEGACTHFYSGSMKYCNGEVWKERHHPEHPQHHPYRREVGR